MNSDLTPLQQYERERRRRQRYNTFFGLMILAVAISKAVYAVFWTPDRALWINANAFNGVTNPEGFIWSLINPLSFGPLGYKLWVYYFDMLMLGIQIKIKAIPNWYLAIHQTLTIYAYAGWGHTYENVTILAIMPFILLMPKLFGTLALMQKLPIWFDWPNLRDHVGCAIYCRNPNIPFYFNQGNFSTYVMLIVCFLMPLIIRRNMKG